MGGLIKHSMRYKVLKERYKTPLAEVCGVLLCESVADTVFSPVRRVDVTPWGNGGETTSAEGGDVYLSL
jgi:hypothetical protein